MYSYNNIQSHWLNRKQRIERDRERVEKKHNTITKYMYGAYNTEIGANLLHILSSRKIIERETSRNGMCQSKSAFEATFCMRERWILDFSIKYLYQYTRYGLTDIHSHSVSFDLVLSLSFSLVYLLTHAFTRIEVEVLATTETANRTHLTNWHKITTKFQVIFSLMFKTHADLHAICQPKFEYKIINMSL